MNRSGLLISLLALVFLMNGAFVYGQTRSELLTTVSANRASRFDYWQNTVLKGRNFRTKKDGTKELASNFVLSIGPNNAWRFDLHIVGLDATGADTAGTDRVYATDGKFHFEASKTHEGFRFGTYGYDLPVLNEIYQAVLAQNQAINISSGIFGIELQEFLALRKVTIDSVEPANSEYGPAELIKFSLAASNVYPRPQHGEFVWLPEKNFCIQTCQVKFGPRSEPNEASKIDFKVKFTPADGKLIPVRGIKREPFITFTTVVDSIAPLAVEAGFFQAESFGLEQPQKPFNTVWVWWGVGVIVVAASVILFFVRK